MANLDPLLILALLVVLILALAAVSGVVVLYRSLQRLVLSNALLEQRVTSLQEQVQRDLLAMGQRILAADKLLNRCDERVGRLENTRPGETQYGQLEAILTKVAAAENRDEVSVAEAQLRSLLQQRSK